MAKKKSVSITIDPDLWEMAGEKLHAGRSQFIEKQLRLAMGMEESEEAKLMKEAAKLQDKLNVVQARICEIRERKRKEKQREKDLKGIKETLDRFKEVRGFVAVNQLKSLARNQDIDYDILTNLCEDMDLKIVAAYEPPKETRKKNGGI